MPKALIVEDDPDAAAAVAACLVECGFEVRSAGTLAAAKAEALSGVFDVVLADVFLPDGTGFDALFEVRQRRPDVPVMLMTGDENVQRAFAIDTFRSMQFLPKPVDFEHLSWLLADIYEAALESELDAAGEDPADSSARRASHSSPLRGVDRLLGSSGVMQHVRELVLRVAPTELSVYVQGESGTGKEIVARAIHEVSARHQGPFVALNCGAIPDTLIDSELFGHEKGAFTGAVDRKLGVFEQAAGGTLFLDEVSEMPVDLQARLLRALEQRKIRRVGGSREVDVDVRVVSATNRDFEAAIDSGQFRSDLFYRLCVMPIMLPPLRERGDDVLELAKHFLSVQLRGQPRPVELTEAALDVLRQHPLPGNVRQLRNVIHRASVLADRLIEPSHLNLEPTDAPPVSSHGGTRLEMRVGEPVAQAERRLVEATLRHLSGDKKATADTLGMSLRTLYNRLQAYALDQHEVGEDRAGADGRSSTSKPKPVDDGVEDTELDASS